MRLEVGSFRVPAAPRNAVSIEMTPTQFVLPKRWIVERIIGWLGRYRRHSKDCERNTTTSEAMIYIAMSHIMLRRLAFYKR
jgi:transposase